MSNYIPPCMDVITYPCQLQQQEGIVVPLFIITCMWCVVLGVDSNSSQVVYFISAVIGEHVLYKENRS